jgi:hypothetical protein
MSIGEHNLDSGDRTVPKLTRPKLRLVILWVLCPLMCAATAASLVFVATRSKWFSLNTVMGWSPRLECVHTLDLGERSSQSFVTGTFQVANSGGSPLEITSIRTKCSCSGLEVVVDGRPRRIERLVLEPGKSQEVIIRFFVTEPPGNVQENAIRFCTNDPINPEHQVVLRISRVAGGFVTSPRAAVFGSLKLNQLARMRVEIRHQETGSRNVLWAEATNGNGVAVDWKPACYAQRGPEGLLLGHLDIQANTALPGTLDCKIIVYLDDPSRPTIEIPVSGTVREPVQVFPGEILLPRRSGDGLVYHGDCLFLSDGEAPLQVAFEKPPPGIGIEVIHGSSDLNKQRVRVTWDPESLRTAPLDAPIIINGMAVLDSQKYPISIRLRRRNE